VVVSTSRIDVASLSGGLNRSRPRSQAQPLDRLDDLERENRELTAKLLELTAAAARNDEVRRKTQERELTLLRANSLTQLIELLQSGLRKSFRLDAVALILHDPQHEMRHLLSSEPASSGARGVQFVDSLFAMAPQLAMLERPWFGRFDDNDHALLLTQTRIVTSLALVPLRRGEYLDGVLVFGSRDPQRFTPDLASDYMAHLGVIAAICLENAVNRARLVRSGLTDFLTGFHNRRYMNARLREELARAQRDKGNVAILMIDVDHFKRINDSYGHLAGDGVLREVAKRIDAQIRLSDTAARFGGDEFAIVLPGGQVRDAEVLARRVRTAVGSLPMLVSGSVTATITLSIGVAVAAPATDSRDLKSMAERLIAEADAALYRSKASGRDCLTVSNSLVT
jgi:two-component system cell cycle response regulator